MEDLDGSAAPLYFIGADSDEGVEIRLSCHAFHCDCQWEAEGLNASGADLDGVSDHVEVDEMDVWGE